jgi:hypothetical protein
MKIDVKTLVIGILLGVCVSLSLGQRKAEPAHKLDLDYRYQIAAGGDQNGMVIFVLDHETKRIYSRTTNGFGAQGRDVNDIVEGR